DEELFGHLFHKNLKGRNIEEAALKTMNELDIGTYYSLTALIQRDNESNLVAMRDKRGVKPMYMGRTESSVFIASESGAIETLRTILDDYMEMRDIVPGELIIAGSDGIEIKQLIKPKPSHCVFEWIYTSRPDAVIEGRTAHQVRKKAGELNVKLHNLKDDGNSVIIGVSDSGRSVALGAAMASGIPFDEGIIKNQYIGRTYIIPDDKERDIAAMLKHNPIKEVIAGKRVIIGDDSIVRGTISEALARTLLNTGAKSVDMLISYAPIFYPCFTDPVDKKLACKGMENLPLDEIERKVAENLKVIKNVYYNSVENVIKAVGLPEESLCTYCITGKNPFSDCSV
ncbi:MAG: hypothetical protein QW761_02655, partial [Candidatus Aenigmatarchaeota archaeon]